MRVIEGQKTNHFWVWIECFVSTHHPTHLLHGAWVVIVGSMIELTP
jgi:hypothetical protein